MGKRSNLAITTKPSNNKCNLSLNDLYTFDPLTENQKRFYTAYKKNQTQAFLLHGMAGTGKSFIALYKALEEAMEPKGKLNRVILIRSAVPSRDIGFLPGNEEEKLSAYQQPYVEICKSLFGTHKMAFQRLQEQGFLTFETTSFLRGLTFDRAIVIVDEVQNLTWEEILTTMTRIGENSKIIFCGDFFQNDLVRKRNDASGLKKFFTILKDMPSVIQIEYQIEDIVRSDLVKEFLLAVKKHNDGETV